MFKTGKNGLANKVVFAFWGAEELNLIGSTFYVSQLTPAQRAAITININVDMLSSSNGVYFVQDAWYNDVYVPAWHEKHGGGKGKGKKKGKKD